MVFSFWEKFLDQHPNLTELGRVWSEVSWVRFLQHLRREVYYRKLFYTAVPDSLLKAIILISEHSLNNL
jgi:hypothetical protein